jgi:peroxiredoxin
MTLKMRKVLSFLLFGAALLAADADRRAPGFSLVDAQAVEHDLADYRGKVVLLAFMQTTCPHCASFAATLQQTQKKYGEKVAVLAVVNPPDDRAKVIEFASGHKLTYPILFDSGQMAYSYVLAPVVNFPHLYIIDPSGTIRGDYVYGPLAREVFEGEKLNTEIDRLLPAAPPSKNR